MSEVVTYFRVKTFHIYEYNKDGNKSYLVPDELVDFICSEKYIINNESDIQYNPDVFIKYIKYISIKNPNSTFRIFYKYIIYNHFMDNEYQNEMIANNGIISNLN